ncbi:CDP-6-deoxy-delta-3,4-glucoseen reductase [Sulfuricaulis limicola]|uniref:CDP-6-deoxy-delta-3,4-glucoseen reductase n=1 Tax=Sulfuricaulis limicola TaxID=1620215 RepID=A0A1B4XDU3_9GAMM|nr:CDP-6-deoxy-delta-3,4-glucoseen reductase [Sulfuricaulis limicola]BAV32958.1 CDP-6-deoxy-delta-3,4-glucoseen reductase [Sulfuricaulis limicola]
MTFKIRIQSSGREFTAKENESVLAAALRQGVMLAYSCRNGACGTCKGKVLSGRVDYGTYETKAMSEAEREQGHALFCQAKPLSDLVIEAKEIAAARDIPIRIMPARVVKMEKLADDVMRLSLKLAEGQRLQYLAGQYIDILLSGNQRRSFSLSTSPLSDELLQLHIRHVPGGFFTGHVFTKMQEKDLLRFQGPFGMFFLREDNDRPAILIAGGTGFAPIKSILEYAFAKGATRPLHLYWGVRARRDLYLHDLSQAWAREHGNFRFTPVLSEPRPEDRWDGRRGWVHEAVAADYPDLSGYEVYASGPPPMIEALKAVVKKHGLPEDRLYYDSFEFAHLPAP